MSYLSRIFSALKQRCLRCRFRENRRIFDRQPVKYPIGYMTGKILSSVKRVGYLTGHRLEQP